MRIFTLAFLFPLVTFVIISFLHSHLIGHPTVTRTVEVLNKSNNSTIYNDFTVVIDGSNIEGFDLKSVHPGLPFTRKSDLRPCSDYFDVEEQLAQALECANNKIFSKSPYNSPLYSVPTPVCNIITTSSPDVRQTPEFNYISLDLLGRTLAFYDTQTKEIFVVETYDMKMIFRHELSHYFLGIKDGGEKCDHCHELWNQCEPPRYTPSKESIENGKGKRNSLIFRLIENLYRDVILSVEGSLWKKSATDVKNDYH